MRRATRALPLLFLLATPAAAQTSPADCPADERPAACPSNSNADAWERISQVLSDMATDPVRQSGDPQPELAVLQRAMEPLDESSAGQATSDGSPTGEPAAERGDGRVEASPARRARYAELLAVLQASGLSWPEACALAEADAYGTDWVGASRTCVARRTGAHTYERFVEVLQSHGASAPEACAAAERYWNGLAVTRAEQVCAAKLR